MTGVEGFEVNNIYIYTWEGRVNDFFFLPPQVSCKRPENTETLSEENLQG